MSSSNLLLASAGDNVDPDAFLPTRHQLQQSGEVGRDAIDVLERLEVRRGPHSCRCIRGFRARGKVFLDPFISLQRSRELDESAPCLECIEHS